MADPSTVQTAKTLSLAVAPVFLISAIGVLLSTMTVRYGRVIDRVRTVLNDLKGRTDLDEIPDDVLLELRRLYGRAKILRATIIMAVISIFLVCATVVSLFSHMMFGFRVPYASEYCFLASLGFLLASLLLLIEDFAISLKNLKVEIKRIEKIVPGAVFELRD